MTQYTISANTPDVVALEEQGKMQAAYDLSHTKIQAQLADVLKDMAERPGDEQDNALIIDGKALLHALNPDTKAKLLEVGMLQQRYLGAFGQ